METNSPTNEPEKGAGSGDAVASKRQPFYKKRAFLVFFWVVLLVSCLGVIYALHARHFEDTDDAFVDGHVTPIGPQVPALVEKVNVQDNETVHKGDLLIELDPTDYKVALAQAEGAEASTKGKLEQARTEVPVAESAVQQAQAELDATQVNLDNMNQDLGRYEGLDDRAKSRQQLDNATAAQKTAAAQVAQARAHLTSAQSQVASAKAKVLVAEGDEQKARADIQRAQVNLGYCRIVAPSDGRVTGKNVEPGMYVTSSSQLFLLVSADVWITANFKETQLDRMQPGQGVTIKIDAYPDRDFQGVVQSIQGGTGSRFSVIPAENATGNFVKVVQRVPVKITFQGEVNSDGNHLLAPGMSVEPTVRVLDGWF